MDVEGPVTLTGSSGTDVFFLGDAISGITAKGDSFGITNKAKRNLPYLNDGKSSVIRLRCQKQDETSFLSTWVEAGPGSS